HQQTPPLGQFAIMDDGLIADDEEPTVTESAPHCRVGEVAHLDDPVTAAGLDLVADDLPDASGLDRQTIGSGPVRVRYVLGADVAQIASGIPAANKLPHSRLPNHATISPSALAFPIELVCLGVALRLVTRHSHPVTRDQRLTGLVVVELDLGLPDHRPVRQ